MKGVLKMKTWQKPVVSTMTTEEINSYIKAAATSDICLNMDFR